MHCCLINTSVSSRLIHSLSLRLKDTAVTCNHPMYHMRHASLVCMLWTEYEKVAANNEMTDLRLSFHSPKGVSHPFHHWLSCALGGVVSHLIICCKFRTHGSSTHSTHREGMRSNHDLLHTETHLSSPITESFWPTTIYQPPCQAQALCQCPLAFLPSSTFTAKHVTTTPTKDHIDQPTNQPANQPTIHTTKLNKNQFTIASCMTGLHTHPHCHIHTLTLTPASCTSASNICSRPDSRILIRRAATSSILSHTRRRFYVL